MLQEAGIDFEKSGAIHFGILPPKSDLESSTAILLMAFSADPVARWTYPNAADYVRYFPEFIRAFAGRAFLSGTAYVSKDEGGTALWLPPNVGPDEDAVMEVFERSVSADLKEDVYNLLEAMGSFHPDEPHWYLPMIGVDTAKQGNGVGSALMAMAVARCDSDELPAYLESTNPRNISLYERFGFEVIGKIQYGGSPPVFPMLRMPR